MFVDPIRGIHLGQQSTRLHQQAGHMIASDQIGTSTHKHLASRGAVHIWVPALRHCVARPG
jgi:thiamine monophosphate synthase